MNRNNIIVIAALILILIIAGVLLIQLQRTNHLPQNNQNVPAATSVQSIQGAQIIVSAEGFTPQTLRITHGSQVTWTNRDKNPHQIASDPYPDHSTLPDLFSPALLIDNTYTYTFDKVGTFTYQDYLNPLKFKATIVVE